MRLTLSHCCCRARFSPRATAALPLERPIEGEDQERDLPSDAASTPNGRAAADEAFRWMNRQVTWQSILADLEVLAWLTETDADG